MKSNLYLSIILLSLVFSIYGKSNAQSPDWLWAKSMGGSGSLVCYSMALDPAGSGDVYVSGEFTGTVDFDPGAETFNLTSNGSEDIFISKLNHAGNFIWAKTIGGAESIATCIAMALDPGGSGDIYITGAFRGTVDFNPGADTFNLSSGGNFHFYICKFDASGNFVWVKTMGGINGDGISNSIVVEPSGSGEIYIKGGFSGTIDFDPGEGTYNLSSTGGANDEDIFILKLDASGNFIWVKAIKGTFFQFGKPIALGPMGSGDVYVTGYYEGTVDFDPGGEIFNLSSAGDNDIYILKLDSSGNFVWAKSIGGPDTDEAYTIALESSGSGGIYITGVFAETVDFDPGQGTSNLISTGEYSAFITKFDDSGEFIWVKAMDGLNGRCGGTSIALDPVGNGSVFIIGGFEGIIDFNPGDNIFNLISGGDFDVFISKLDASGNFLWAKAMGGDAWELGSTVAIDTAGSGNVHVAGIFESPFMSFGSITLTKADTTAAWDLFIAKLDVATTSAVYTDPKTEYLSIYPNPATNELTIEFDGSEFLDVEITLYNLSGQLVYSMADQNVGKRKTIQVNSLPPGVYFIDVKVDGNRMVRKVVKE